MLRRHDTLCDAAIGVVASSGLRGLTYRAVDDAAGLPVGSTSNCFKTRAELIKGIVQRMGDLELEQLKAAVDRAPNASTAVYKEWASDGLGQTLVRLELMLEAVRSPHIAAALSEQRARFAEYANAEDATHGLPLTENQLVALMAGLQFAEITTGVELIESVTSLLDHARTRPIPTMHHGEGRRL